MPNCQAKKAIDVVIDGAQPQTALNSRTGTKDETNMPRLCSFTPTPATRTSAAWETSRRALGCTFMGYDLTEYPCDQRMYVENSIDEHHALCAFKTASRNPRGQLAYNHTAKPRLNPPWAICRPFEGNEPGPKPSPSRASRMTTFAAKAAGSNRARPGPAPGAATSATRPGWGCDLEPPGGATATRRCHTAIFTIAGVSAPSSVACLRLLVPRPYRK